MDFIPPLSVKLVSPNAAREYEALFPQSTIISDSLVSKPIDQDDGRTSCFTPSRP
jgi:hypothetical protein